MSRELELSIHFLDLILGNNGEVTADGVSELFEIHAGNKEVIKQHLKAITNIMNKALEELDEKKEYNDTCTFCRLCETYQLSDEFDGDNLCKKCREKWDEFMTL